MQDEWFRVRGAALGVSPEAARQRDQAMPTNAPPADAWDQQTAAQAEAMWGQWCSTCHGSRGRLEGVTPDKPVAKKLRGVGISIGFFFGGDSMRAGFYKRISEGGRLRDGKESSMPAWGDVLAKEQIWALVLFIERL